MPSFLWGSNDVMASDQSANEEEEKEEEEEIEEAEEKNEKEEEEKKKEEEEEKKKKKEGGGWWPWGGGEDIDEKDGKEKGQTDEKKNTTITNLTPAASDNENDENDNEDDDDDDDDDDDSDLDGSGAGATTAIPPTTNDVTIEEVDRSVISLLPLTPLPLTELPLPVQTAPPSRVLDNHLLQSLTTEFNQCTSCMGTDQQQCTSYERPIEQLQKRVARLSSLLLYGCPKDEHGQSVCCHKGNAKIESYLLDVSEQLAKWELLLRHQCDKCPVDCRWTDRWTEWTLCNMTCTGHYYRSRTRYSEGPFYGGKPCIPETATQQESCPITPTVYREWAEWGVWSQCSSSCGGTRTRVRQCPPSREPCSIPCTGSDTDLKACGDSDNCCVTAKWSAWNSWSLCPENNENENFSRHRNRTCESADYHRPICPGQCLGSDCDTDKCPTCQPSTMTQWEVWGQCSNIAGKRTRTIYLPHVPRHLIDGDGRACQEGCRTRKRQCRQGTCPKVECEGNTIEYIQCYLGPCCVKGEWTDWSAWSDCLDNECQTRSRHCSANHIALNFTQPRPLCMTVGCRDKKPEVEHKICPKKCVDGDWSGWGAWDRCSVTCGGGSQSRTRRCDRPAPNQCGRDCLGKSFDQKPCQGADCCVDGDWGGWSAWNSCSVTCGRGSQSRTRRCDRPAPNQCGRKCQGNTVDQKPCQGADCCVDGDWGGWGAWNSCSVTCGRGSQSRTRRCDRPTPNQCGRKCRGEYYERQPCKGAADCCVNGGWSGWGSWAGCSVTCGDGSRSRLRRCDSPTPNQCGKICPGSKTDRQRCREKDCCVDGGWGVWGSWESCSVTCGTGYQRKTRQCDSPTPNRCGQTCLGESNKYQACKGKDCCVDGDWGGWGSWTMCSVTCGKGSQSRIRRCDRPAPNLCGRRCRGDSLEEKSCGGTGACCVDGNWGGWGSWSDCSQTCGTGSQLRTRECDSPAPNQCGRTCPGYSIAQRRCDNGGRKCCVDGAWGGWGEWERCTASCGAGSQTRRRLCDGPAANHCGRTCVGDAIDGRGCPGLPPCRQCQESCAGKSDGFHVALCSENCSKFIKCCDGAMKGPAIDCPRNEVFVHSCKNCIPGNRCLQNAPRTCPVPNVRPVEMNPCRNCTEDCKERADGLYASKCKPGCQHYYRCCSGVPITMHGCPHFYNARCGCCTNSRPDSCRNGVEHFMDIHDAKHFTCHTITCTSHPENLVARP